MVLEARTKIYRSKDNRHYLYVPMSIIKDSAFPLDLEKDLTIRIEDNRLILEQAHLDTTRKRSLREKPE